MPRSDSQRQFTESEISNLLEAEAWRVDAFLDLAERTRAALPCDHLLPAARCPSTRRAPAIRGRFSGPSNRQGTARRPC
jgi:hypothetical protein